MSIPPYVFTLKKNDVVNDAAPVAAPPFDRTFIIPVAETDGEFISNVRIIGRFYDGANKAVAGTYTAILYWYDEPDGEGPSVWTACGPFALPIGPGYRFCQSGATVSLPTGGRRKPAYGFVRITDIATATGVRMVFDYHFDESDIVQRTCDGLPIVSANATLDPATLALLADIDTQVTGINTKTPALGTNVMAGSSPVTIATDDTLVLDIAVQTGGINTQVSAINTKTPILGPAAKTAAVPVTIAYNDMLITSIDNKIPALGTNVMAGSSPVTIATDDVLLSYTKSTADSLAAVIAPNGNAAPASALQDGGYAGVPGTSAPAATVAGRLKAFWVDLYGATVGRLVGPDENDLFPSAAIPADGAANDQATTTIRSRSMGFNGVSWDRVRAGITALTTTVTGWQNVLVGVLYNASPTARTEGQYGPPQGDIQGNVKVTQGTMLAGEDTTNNVLATVLQPMAVNTHAASVGSQMATSQPYYVAKAAAGTLYSITGYNANAATRYIQVHNLAVAPTSTSSVPLFTFPVPSGQAFSLDLTPYGVYNSTGITVAISSAGNVYNNTGVVAADLLVTVVYA